MSDEFTKEQLALHERQAAVVAAAEVIEAVSEHE